MKKKIINLLIICIVLISCQQETNKTKQEYSDVHIDETETNSYEYDNYNLSENWFDIKFEDFTISIDNLDLKYLTPTEYNEIHQDTAVFYQMPGSDALMNRTIKISESKFDEIIIFEKMDQDSDWKELERIGHNSVFKAGPYGCEFLKIILSQTASGLIIEKIIILEPSTTC